MFINRAKQALIYHFELAIGALTPHIRANISDIVDNLLLEAANNPFYVGRRVSVIWMEASEKASAPCVIEAEILRVAPRIIDGEAVRVHPYLIELTPCVPELEDFRITSDGEPETPGGFALYTPEREEKVLAAIERRTERNLNVEG